MDTLSFVLFLASLGSAYSCSNVTPAANFNLTSYKQGRWYEIARYKVDVEENADCVTYNYESDGKYYLREVKNNKVTHIKVDVKPTEEPGRVMLYMEGSASPEIPSLILATDNTNYALFYDCADGKSESPTTEYAWIVSRTPSISPELKSVIHKYMDETHFLSKEKFSWDHLTPKDCMLDEVK